MRYELQFGETLQGGRTAHLPTIVGSGSSGFPYEVIEEIPLHWKHFRRPREASRPYQIALTESFLASVFEDSALFEPTRATTTSRDIEKHPPLSPPFDQLSPSVAIALTSQWQLPCEAAFDFLADYFETELVRLVSSGTLRPVDLTLAAESIGRIPTSNLVRETLNPLLNHPDALVREGALYGMRGHLNEEIRDRLARIAESDPSREVRQVAADVLVSS